MGAATVPGFYGALDNRCIAKRDPFNEMDGPQSQPFRFKTGGSGVKRA